MDGLLKSHGSLWGLQILSHEGVPENCLFKLKLITEAPTCTLEKPNVVNYSMNVILQVEQVF